MEPLVAVVRVWWWWGGGKGRSGQAHEPAVHHLALGAKLPFAPFPADPGVLKSTARLGDGPGGATR